jgi:hypothetical protein
MMGYPSSTTNQNIKYGIWSWGSVELTFPNSYCLSYKMSNGYKNNASPISNLTIGCVYNFVDALYMSWSYTDANAVTHYGLDLLDNSCAAATTASWEALIFDGGARYQQKGIERYKVSTIALPTGSTLTPYYSIDRGTTVTSAAPSTAGATDALMDINKRFHEFIYGLNITTADGTMTPPTVTSVAVEVDPGTVEANLMPDG